MQMSHFRFFPMMPFGPCPTTELSKLTQRVKTAIRLLLKHDLFKLRVFLPLKKISLHFLNLGAPLLSQEGEEGIMYWIIQTNTACKNCNWLASKTWSIQAVSFLPMKKISLHLLNLGAPPQSQEGGERIICSNVQTNTAYKNCNWLAIKTWSIQATSFSI